MKKNLFLLLFIFSGFIDAQQFPVLKGNYLGQKPPGDSAVIFASGIISTIDNNEHTCSFSPDGNTIFFTRDPDRKTFVTRKINKQWSNPVPADFDGREAIFSPDGNKLFFTDGDIWFVERKGDGWSETKKLPPTINTDSYEYYASLTQTGTIYFSRFVDGQAKIFTSILVEEKYIEAEELPSPINQDLSNSFHPFISPKGDYIIFNSDREGGFGDTDLYVSYKDLNNNWQEPINLGSKINTELRDICPTITPDGKFLFFTRNWQNDGKWYGNIYWIDTFFLKK